MEGLLLNHDVKREHRKLLRESAGRSRRDVVPGHCVTEISALFGHIHRFWE